MKNQELYIHNTLSRKKELFTSIEKNQVGMYVCGPTVYGDGHLGHARPAISFDLVFRYLKHLGYKVRYVRNITDVGHLVNDADEGEDKIAKKAKLDNLEPMEVVQHFTVRYHQDMAQLNVLTPSIEPHASGHIIEQITFVEKILEKGFAYIVNGSVYFDVEKYNQNHNYGILSGRKIEDLIANTRTLDGQDEKRNSYDFALWKKAAPEHIMRWPSPWSDGFPGWHMECSAMGSKYLGDTFDIHGGGLDLLFPHHECEIAQAVAAKGINPVNYWMHNNMITINGQKMGKSLGNFITLRQFFTGDHFQLERAYSPMNVRFFILQANYRSTLDFSNEALQAAEKGLKKLMTAGKTLEKLKSSETSSKDVDINALSDKCYAAMNDDFNSPILIAHLFEAVRIVNSVNDGKSQISKEDLTALKTLFQEFVFDILGLQDELVEGSTSELIDGLMQTLISLRKEARENKDWATSDAIRDKLNVLNISLKDGKDGTRWSIDD